MKTADYSFLKTTEMSCLNKIQFNVTKRRQKTGNIHIWELKSDYFSLFLHKKSVNNQNDWRLILCQLSNPDYFGF